MPRLELSKEHVFYFSRGSEGTPLLFIHGAGGAHANWLTLIKLLQPKCCIALDLPGHGLSSGDGCETIEAYAEIVKSFAASLFPDMKCVVIGHSMGGLIGTSFVSRNPALAAGLILVSSGFSPPSPPPEKAPTKEKICRMLYSKEELIQECTKQRLFMLDRPEVLLKDLQASARFDYKEHPVDKKILKFVLTGQEDHRIALEAIQTAAEFLNVSLEVIPDCGHMPMIEKQKETAETIRQFLDRNGL